MVEGPIELVDQEGNSFKVAEGDKVLMCRCGQSDNKPFCDASHRKKISFDAPTTAV